MHDPDRVEAAAEARELGRRRRRKEGTLVAAFEFEGLDSVPKLRRLLEIAGFDLLGLENTIARCRTLVSVVLAAGKLLEVGQLEERIKALEDALGPRPVRKRR